MSKTKKADEAILELLIQSPEEGIRTLQSEYGGLIFQIVFRILHSYPQDAEEVAADVLLAAWRHAKNLMQTHRPLAAWLTVTARNRAIDRWRMLTRHPEIELNEEWIGADSASSTDAEALIGELVHSLSEPDREIFLRRYYRQETAKEIGQALQMAPNTVNVRLSRGREKLKQLYLKEMGKEQDHVRTYKA